MFYIIVIFSTYIYYFDQTTDLLNINGFSGKRGLIFTSDQPVFFEYIKSYTTEPFISSLNDENDENVKTESDEKDTEVESSVEESVLQVSFYYSILLFILFIQI
jgi:hypothetical protein